MNYTIQLGNSIYVAVLASQFAPRSLFPQGDALTTLLRFSVIFHRAAASFFHLAGRQIYLDRYSESTEPPAIFRNYVEISPSQLMRIHHPGELTLMSGEFLPGTITLIFLVLVEKSPARSVLLSFLPFFFFFFF